MGLRCCNDYWLYCAKPSRQANLKKYPGTDIIMPETTLCPLSPTTCGYTETLVQQVAKLPPLPEKKKEAKKR